MKHSPIALGFAAFSALSVMTACNVDESRVDKNAKINNEKLKCNVESKRLNLTKVNKNRLSALSAFPDAKVRSVRQEADGTLMKPKANAINAVYTAASAEKDEAITLKYDCDTLTAQLVLPKSLMKENKAGVPTSTTITADIDKVGTHKVELSNGDEKIIVETIGIDVPMAKIDDEDGVNQVKVTITGGDTEAVFVSDATKNSNEEVVFTDEDGEETGKMSITAIEEAVAEQLKIAAEDAE